MALIDQTRPEAVHMSDTASQTSSPGSAALKLCGALVGRAAVLSVTSFIGIPLFTLWVVFVAFSPLTLLAPVVIPVAWLMRRYATANRHAAGHLLGERIDEPYRPAGQGMIGRITGIIRDPASWRDAWWSISHVVVGAFLSIFSLALLAGSVLHVIYPFLYAITPQNVFGRPYNLFDLSSVAESFALVPVGLIGLLIWWFAAPAMARAEAAYTRSMLR